MRDISNKLFLSPLCEIHSRLSYRLYATHAFRDYAYTREVGYQIIKFNGSHGQMKTKMQ